MKGAAGGKGCSVISTVPVAAGVVLPQAGVKSETPSLPGRWFRPVSGRRWLEPHHWPSIATRSTTIRPSSVTPTLERFECGGVFKTPSCMSIPLGRPSSHVKRSPLTPATVAIDDTRLCMEVTVSRPRIEPFESTGRSA